MKLINNLSNKSLLLKCFDLGYDPAQSHVIISYLQNGLDLLPHIDTTFTPRQINNVGLMIDIIIENEGLLSIHEIKE